MENRPISRKELSLIVCGEKWLNGRGHQSTEVSGLLKVGVGAFAIRSEQGAFQHLETGFNTAIHVPVDSRSFLSLGLSPRIRNNRIDLSDLVVRDASMDQPYQSLFLNGASNTYFNINSL